MGERQREVSTTAELMAALADPAIGHVTVSGVLDGLPALRLSPGQGLSGAAGGATLRFAPGEDGVRLTTDNRLEGLELVADPDRCAVHNDGEVERLGRLELRGLRVTGAVRLLAHDRVRSGHVEAHDVAVIAADVRGWNERPRGYGVEVVPGAFALWNRQADPSVTISADLSGISAGRAGAPVRGGGVFVAGAGGNGGRVVVHRLETGAVHSDGGIAPGTADRISGGVFTVHGAHVALVRNHGPVVTYGANDMVLDNWGTVERWTAEDRVTSHGPSAIGFVNFGTLGVLRVEAPVETFGGGSRGFNVYDGTVDDAEFDRVVTHADGAVGIQISRPVGRIAVRRGIETHGGVGPSLVKGVVMPLPATALSVKPGGSARAITVSGGLLSHGEGVEALQLHGTVERLAVEGGVGTLGGGFAGL